MTTSTALAVTPEERSAREQEGALLLDQAQALLIDDADSFTKAGAWLREVVAPLKKTIADTFRPRIEQAHALHKGLLADERRFLGPVEAAEQLVRGRLVIYAQEQERIRREAEAAAQRERERLEREAREQAEAESRRLQAEAETRRLDEAAALEAAGDREGAERLVAAPVAVPTVVAAPVFAPRPAPAPPPKLDGVSFRDEWVYEITDAALIPRAYLIPDEKAIGGVVRAMRAATAIPGIRAFPRRISSVRRA